MSEPVNWKERFNVQEFKEIGVSDELQVILGINVYNDQPRIMIAKLSKRGFVRRFVTMDVSVAEVLAKELPKYIQKTKELAKTIKIQKAKAEIERLKKEFGAQVLKELGIKV